MDNPDYSLTDLPRAELMERAEQALSEFQGAEVHFSYTCIHCGTRCHLADKNTLWSHGECSGCGGVTKIEKGGFMLVFKDEWERGNGRHE